VVAPSGAEQDIAFLYPNYPELAERFTDPCAEDVAAFLTMERATERVAA
jgi:hypothetical protein